MRTTDLRWWKSSRSSNAGTNCVEVATADDTWYVRDSKDPERGVLTVHSGQWRRFLSQIRSGAFTGHV